MEKELISFLRNQVDSVKLHAAHELQKLEDAADYANSNVQALTQTIEALDMAINNLNDLKGE